MSERNSFGFQGGQFVEGGRQCVVVDVDKVHGGWIYRKGRTECFICRWRETGQMDLRLLKGILRSCLGSGTGMSITSVMSRWSEMERSVLETLWMWRPVEQTRSGWVGKFMCWVKLKQLSRSRKSIAFLHAGESMWRLKSPRSNTDGEILDSAVMNSEKSARNDGLGLGGAVDD